jgi:hypothetical protein
MDKKTRLEIWNRDSIVLLDREKMHSKKCNLSTEENASALARILLEHMCGDALDMVLEHMLSAVQYDHPDYTESDMANDINRAVGALSNLETLLEHD